MSIKVLTYIYWISMIILGPTTVFAFQGNPDGNFVQRIPMWVGIVVFWAITCIAVVLSYVVKNKETDFSTWYKNVFLYGAHELAYELAIRHDELRTAAQPWWQ